MAGLAAAVGADFSLDLLTEASDLDPGIVVGAVDELWQRRILREFGDGYDFSHDLLREAAYPQVSPPKRWLLHRRVAQGLELLHAADPDQVASQLAEQYARGRPRRAGGVVLPACGRRGGRPSSPHDEAIRLHREALDIVGAMPAGRGRDRQELDVLEAIAAPLNALDGYASPELQPAPGALDRARRVARPHGRDGHRSGRALVVAVRAGPHRRALPGRHPGAVAGRVRSGAERAWGTSRSAVRRSASG